MHARAFAGLLAVLTVLVAPASAASGDGWTYRSVTLRPVENVSLPFWCDWGYDWDERCYREIADRLPIGGDVDKVWRAALRFSLAALPVGAYVADASLRVHHDGTCLGPRKTSRSCGQRTYTFDLHPIVGPWFTEREPEYGPAYARATLGDASGAATLTWDATDLVAEWVDGRLANDGMLLRLVDEHEDFDVGGPKVPSASFPDTALRPSLEVVYVVSS